MCLAFKPAPVDMVAVGVPAAEAAVGVIDVRVVQVRDEAGVVLSARLLHVGVADREVPGLDALAGVVPAAVTEEIALHAPDKEYVVDVPVLVLERGLDGVLDLFGLVVARVGTVNILKCQQGRVDAVSCLFRDQWLKGVYEGLRGDDEKLGAIGVRAKSLRDCRSHVVDGQNSILDVLCGVGCWADANRIGSDDEEGDVLAVGVESCPG